MKSQVILISIISLLIYTSCGKDDGCHLTENDMEWLQEEYDSLYFLKNHLDTIVIPNNTYLDQNEYDWEYGIRTGDNDYFGVHRYYFADSTLSLRIIVRGCREYIGLSIRNRINSEYHYYYPYKDSTLTNYININGYDYTDYFVFNNDSLGITELLFAKKYGVIKVLTEDSILLERISQNID